MRVLLRPLAVACLEACAVVFLGSGCSRSDMGDEARLVPGSSAPTSRRVIAFGQPIPKGGGIYKVGEPYQIDGRSHVIPQFLGSPAALP